MVAVVEADGKDARRVGERRVQAELVRRERRAWGGVVSPAVMTASVSE